MSLEEKIKDSYLEYWDQLPELAKGNALYGYGYIHKMFLEKENGSLLDCIEMETNELGFFRPKSLQGIENNNGWIKIESEAYLPKNKGYYDFQKFPHDVYKINPVFWCPSSTKIGWFIETYTHYQQIDKLKPPIY